MIPYDVYVLSAQRSKSTIELFLRQFAMGMEESAVDYPVPQYTDSPMSLFTNTMDLLEYLLCHGNEPYIVYYRKANATGAVRNAMICFTRDATVILGLTIKVANPCLLADYLMQLASAVDAKWGFWTVEQPPPVSSLEFIELAKRAQSPKLNEGFIG